MNEPFFLTVVAWPEWTSAFEADFAKAIGVDIPTARLRSKSELPLTTRAPTPHAAENAARLLVSAGGDAFMFSLSDLKRPPATDVVQQLMISDGAIALTFMGGVTTTIRPAQIQGLVRATLTDTARQKHEQWTGTDVVNSPLGTRMSSATPLSAFEKIELLDLHTADTGLYRLDGRRFGYHALGELRGHGDKANMDAMLKLLSHLAPNALVDQFFPLWRAPAGCKRLRLERRPGPRVPTAFEFYSRWTALLYRHMMSGEGS